MMHLSCVMWCVMLYFAVMLASCHVSMYRKGYKCWERQEVRHLSECRYLWRLRHPTETEDAYTHVSWTWWQSPSLQDASLMTSWLTPVLKHKSNLMKCSEILPTEYFFIFLQKIYKVNDLKFFFLVDIILQSMDKVQRNVMTNIL